MQNLTASHVPYPNLHSNEISRICERLLFEIGIPGNLKGYRYLIIAAETVYHDGSAIHNVLKGLYADIARRENTNASCVERNIRTAIKIMWDNRNDHISDKPGCIVLKHMPEPRELIALLANAIRIEMTALCSEERN